MDISFVERLMALLARSALIELDYRNQTGSLRLVKHPAIAPERTVPLPNDQSRAFSPQSRGGLESEIRQIEHVISAGIGGVFHRRPSANNPPFVEAGDLVSEGQTLGVMEAMKVFVPIEADRAGQITKILQDDGAAVEIGTPLFSLDPSD